MNMEIPKNNIEKEEVINVYKKFVDRGIKNPDDLDLNDPEVKEANELFYEWQEQQNLSAKGNKELERQINLYKTMLYVDAGFTDPNYLTDVLDWLNQDAEIEKVIDNPENTETRKQMAEAIKKVRSLLKNK